MASWGNSIELNFRRQKSLWWNWQRFYRPERGYQDALPWGWMITRIEREKCTAYLSQRRMLAGSIACCLAPPKGKNREKACAGCLPTRVCTSNPKGDRAKALAVTGRRNRHAKSFPFIMKKLIQWHKDMLNNMVYRFDLSFYQMVWVAWIKGLVIGYLIALYL